MSGSGSGLKKFMDPDPVCPERLDPDPVNIRPDPQPCLQHSPALPFHLASSGHVSILPMIFFLFRLKPPPVRSMIEVKLLQANIATECYIFLALQLVQFLGADFVTAFS